MLDPAGLAHAFAALGISIDDLALRRVDDVYEVEADGAAPVRIFADLGATVERLERDHRGQGVRYRKLVAAVTKVHRALAPLQVKARPSPLALIRAGAAWHAPFLLRSLAGVLAGAGLRGVVAEAVGTWTHVTGQPLDAAPSPLALVPAMIHGPGCFVPSRGEWEIAVLRRARLSRFPAVVPAPRGGARRRDVHVRHARLPRT